MCEKCNVSVNSENGNYCFECGYELIENPIIIGGVRKAKFVDGDPKKTRSEYFSEVESLEKQLEEKEDLKNKLYNLINEKENTIKELEKNKTNNTIAYIIIIIGTACIAYYVGIKRKK